MECGTEEVSHVQDGESARGGCVVVVGVFLNCHPVFLQKTTQRLVCHVPKFQVMF